MSAPVVAFLLVPSKQFGNVRDTDSNEKQAESVVNHVIAAIG